MPQHQSENLQPGHDNLHSGTLEYRPWPDPEDCRARGGKPLGRQPPPQRPRGRGRTRAAAPSARRVLPPRCRMPGRKAEIRRSAPTRMVSNIASATSARVSSTDAATLTAALLISRSTARCIRRRGHRRVRGDLQRQPLGGRQPGQIVHPPGGSHHLQSAAGLLDHQDAPDAARRAGHGCTLHGSSVRRRSPRTVPRAARNRPGQPLGRRQGRPRSWPPPSGARLRPQTCAPAPW